MRRNWSSARTIRKALVLFPFIALLFGASGVAPADQSWVLTQVTPHQQNPFGDLGDSSSLEAEKRMHALNVERHKNMVSDANKLLQLAKELNAELAANTNGTLTNAELHKTAAIEKLAHAVREKMALSFSGAPQLQDPSYRPGRLGVPPLGPE